MRRTHAVIAAIALLTGAPSVSLLTAAPAKPSSADKKLADFQTQYKTIEIQFNKDKAAARADAVPLHSKGLLKLAGWCRSCNLLNFEEMVYRRILDDDPDHKEARKKLGYSQKDGKWMTQYAADKRQSNQLPYKTHGYVKKDDWTNLEKGLLPIKGAWAPREEQWARVQKDWKDAWVLEDDKWRIVSDAPYERALEMMNLLGQEYLLICKLFEGEIQVLKNTQKYAVNFFRDTESLKKATGKPLMPDVLGYFSPGTNASYFYELGPDRSMSTFCVVLHEAMHQMTYNIMRFQLGGDGPNYWLVEGFADYLSMYEPKEPGGDLRLMPMVAFARHSQLANMIRTGKGYRPIQEFIELNQKTYNSDEYAQGSFLCRYFLHGAGGQYRQAFIKYVTITRIQGQNMTKRFEEFFGKKPAEFDDEFKAYVLDGIDDSRLYPLDGQGNSTGGSGIRMEIEFGERK